MRARHALASLFALLPGLTVAPDAHALDAASASSLVTLIADASTPTCPATTASRSFGDRLLPNGTRVRFTVPDGQVLVITSFDWVADQGFRFDETTWATVDLFDGSRYQHAVVSSARFDLRGRAAGNTVVPDGIVVRSGTAMCFGFDGTVSADRSFARIHGFLARDT